MNNKPILGVEGYYTFEVIQYLASQIKANTIKDIDDEIIDNLIIISSRYKIPIATYKVEDDGAVFYLLCIGLPHIDMEMVSECGGVIEAFLEPLYGVTEYDINIPEAVYHKLYMFEV